MPLARSACMIRGRGGLGALAAALLLLGCASGSDSAVLPSTPESRASAGKDLFATYCASCHGKGAGGDGPVAASLLTKPKDLTQIAERNDGVFDAATVARFIDGRARVAEHGPKDMPVWGRSFDDRIQTGVRDETRLAPGAIYLLVEYLRSVQAGGV
jgi:mono/diheme cytochrome c family protein